MQWTNRVVVAVFVTYLMVKINYNAWLNGPLSNPRERFVTDFWALRETLMAQINSGLKVRTMFGNFF